MALVLRETKGSPLTFEEMDDNLVYLESRGFPFIGAATIDGTLNIDFTDTLDFITDNDYTISGFPIFEGIVQGDVIGLEYSSESGDTIFSGLHDGVVDIGGGFAQIIQKRQFSTFVNTTDGIFIEQDLGKREFPVELGGSTNFGVGNLAIFTEAEEEYLTYGVSIGKEIGGDNDGYSQIEIFKAYDTEESEETVRLRTSNTGTGFEFSNDLSDLEASFVLFMNNNGDTVLDVKNDGIVSDDLALKDFADDTAAAAGGVPLNGLYHTSGVVKIRLV